MIPLLEKQHRGGRRAHTGGKGEAVFGRLQTCERRLERRARRIVGPRVVVPFMNAGRALRVSAGLKDRNSDRAGGGFGLLSGMDGTRGELHEVPAALLSCHQSCPPK